MRRAALLSALLCTLCLGQHAEDSVAHAADWETGAWPAVDALVLPELSAELTNLLAAAPPPYEKLTAAVVRLEHVEARGYGVRLERDSRWAGLQLPRTTEVAEEGPLRLALRLVAGRPLLSTGGEALALDTLGALLADRPAVQLHVAGDVPCGFAISLTARLLDAGVMPTFTVVPRPQSAPPVPAALLAELFARESPALPRDWELPRIALRIRADARVPWSEVSTLLDACSRHDVYRFTFTARVGARELDLSLLPGTVPPQSAPLVAIPEVELTEEIPRGTNFDNMSNKNLDSTAVEDAFGIGGGAAGTFGTRFGREALAAEGGTEESEAAVGAALAWLDRHQTKEGARRGAWRAEGWPDRCALDGHAPCSGPSFAEPDKVGPGRGDGDYDVGVTALALLAFLGHGETHKIGAHKRTVRTGLDWLRAQQDADGAIGWDPMMGESVYNHALATTALCEALAMSRDFRLEKAAQAAVDWCLAAQNPGMGWQYGVRTGKNDSSVTSAMVMALKAAQAAGLEVPAETFADARGWFDRATALDGRTGYNAPGSGSAFMPALERAIGGEMYRELPVMTAAAVASRIAAGEERTSEAIAAGAEVLLGELPAWDGEGYQGVSFYYWYYGTLAMFQLGGEGWTTWNQALQEALVPTQRDDGSWDPLGEWAFVGGRVYATALNALSLEIYYRFPRD